jgi:hypothetical protein
VSNRLTKNQKRLLESMPTDQWIGEKRANELEKQANTSFWLLAEKSWVLQAVVWGFPFATPEDRLVAQILHKDSWGMVFWRRLSEPLEPGISPRADFHKTDTRLKDLRIPVQQKEAA